MLPDGAHRFSGVDGRRSTASSHTALGTTTSRKASVEMKDADAREIDEGRVVSDDEHEEPSALALRNGVELLLEILDVVIDGVEAVPTGLDEEIVERCLERACRDGASQAAGSYFVDDEQETRAPTAVFKWS